MATGYCNTHCSNCISSRCLQRTCPIIQCACKSRMHECKQRDHETMICPEAEVDCPIKSLGCPLKIKRRQTLAHLKVCPANTIICNMQRFRLFGRCNLDKYMDPAESDPIALGCHIHDIAMMRRFSKKMKFCEKQLEVNPKRDEIESRIKEDHGCECGSWNTFYYGTMGDSEIIVTCQNVIKREEVTEHRWSHLCLPLYLTGNCCPMQRYGCNYQPCPVEFDVPRYTLRFEKDVCGLVVDREPQQEFEVDYDRISPLPHEVMSLIIDHLDGFSLRSLSLTSRYMRELCFERLYTNGIVNVEWERGGDGWVMGRKLWSFSKVSKLPEYHRNATVSTEISRHLKNCKFYKRDRVDYKSLPDKLELVPWM